MEVYVGQIREYVVSTIDTKGRKITEGQRMDVLHERIKTDGIVDWDMIDEKVLRIAPDLEIHIYRIRVDVGKVTI